MAKPTHIAHFQDQWVKLVKHYCAGDPPTQYLRSWEDLEPWEQENAVRVYELVQHLAWTVGWPILSLDREQKGRFLHTCMVAQIEKRAPEAERFYTSHWDQLPTWQQESYAALFELIEAYQEVADTSEFIKYVV